MLTSSIAVLKYLNAMVNMDKLKDILLAIRSDSERHQNQPEYRIFHKHSMEGRTSVVAFAGYMCFAAVTYMSLAVHMLVEENANRVNASVPREFLYQVDYHVDHEKYFYPITAHTYYVTLLVIAIIVALDTLYIIVIQHSCVLFAVLGFKLRTAHILNESVLYQGDEYKNVRILRYTVEEENRVFRKLVGCAMEHNRALEYVKLLHAMFSRTLLAQIIVNILSLSVSGIEILLQRNNFDVVLGMIVWLVGDEVHLFFLCLSGQRLSDFSENVYYDAVECMWYTFFAKSKVVYLFFVMNTLMPQQLVALKLTALNMETFQAVRSLSSVFARLPAVSTNPAARRSRSIVVAIQRETWLQVTRMAASYFTVLSSTL
nr:uncharacterized protein LOC116434707 isoform X3 [Nomia melanderi]